MKVNINDFKIDEKTEENINNLYSLIEPILNSKLINIFGNEISNIKYKGLDLRKNKNDKYCAKIHCEFINKTNEEICTNIYIKEKI